MKPWRDGRLLFVLALGLALAWALVTDHVWEDYFITFRASRHLAEGLGLVFQEGERLHTFTSPLGVLLPTLCHLVSGRGSELVTLWLFRVLGALAFAGLVVASVAVVRRSLGTRATTGAGVGLAVLVMLDPKILDYATNGMETPFLLLGFAWTLWVLIARPERETWHLGAAWAGLMWCRPDAFIYIGLMALGVWWWRPRREGETWWRVGAQYLRAGMLTTALYGPWLGWAAWYYGTPIPHTIKAKGLFGREQGWVEMVAGFPVFLWEKPALLAAVFLPPYAPYVDWPRWGFWLAVPVALGGVLLWLLPRVPWTARVCSFASLGGLFYLAGFVGFAVPWYVPTVTWFGLLAWGLTGAHVLAAGPGRVVRGLVRGGVLAGGLALGATTVMAAYQMYWQQRLVEWGNRRVLGEWLATQAETMRDTVFLEPLGYIGYYSGLKMLDYPGLSSPEVVAARRHAGQRAYPDCWHEIIEGLEPDWLVLRESEAAMVRGNRPDLLLHDYVLARTFDVRESVRAVPALPGRDYLLNDALYFVYRRQRPKSPPLAEPVFRTRLDLHAWDELAGWGQPPYQSDRRILAHAPASMRADVEPVAGLRLRGAFGLLEGAYASPPSATDGAAFVVEITRLDGREEVLWRRGLDPVRQAGDRERQTFAVDVPADTREVRVRVEVGEWSSNAFDWGYWEDLQFTRPLWPEGYPGTWRPRLPAIDVPSPDA